MIGKPDLGIKMHIPKIVSGGQTGADRAALDWAQLRGIQCGGWCPRGRKAEDGAIPAKYPLVESTSANYLQRTEWNVRDTDGTVIFSIDRILSGGSKKTFELAEKHNKSWLHLHAGMKDAAPRLKEFVAANEIETLNVAGSRASKEPGIGEFVREVLEAAFAG